MDLLRNIFRGDKVVWIIFLCLCVISIIEVFSASSTLAYKTGNHLAPISRHAVFLLVGAGAVWAFHLIPYQWYQVFPRILLPVAGIFLVLLLAFDDLHIGSILVIEKTNEAGRWVKFFGLPFQPSEFAKMGIIIYTAWRLSRGQTEQGADPKAFKVILGVGGVTCFLILPENYSTAVLLFGVVFLMMFVGRVQARKLLKLGGGLMAVAALFVGFLFVTPNDTLEKIPLGHRFTTVKSRIANFTNDEKVPPAKYDMSGNGRQVGNARIAVATSGFLGKGPGNSVQRDFLSQAYSDFIFAIIIEELGLAGGIIVAPHPVLAHRQPVRAHVSGLPGAGRGPAADGAGHVQHDGGRGLGPRHGAAAAPHQPRRYVHPDQLCVHRHHPECQPLYHRAEGASRSGRHRQPVISRHHPGGASGRAAPFARAEQRRGNGLTPIIRLKA